MRYGAPSHAPAKVKGSFAAARELPAKPTEGVREPAGCGGLSL